MIAGHVALDFVNTLDYRFSPNGSQELLTSYQELLRFSEQAGALTATQRRSLQRRSGTDQAENVLHTAIELREALAEIFYGGFTNAALSVLNTQLNAGLCHRKIQQQGETFAWGWNGIDKAVDGPLWAIAHAAATLLTSEQMRQVRQCGNETCRWLFLDTSKNHSRRWCDMSLCGNRIKARRFYARHKTDLQR